MPASAAQLRVRRIGRNRRKVAATKKKDTVKKAVRGRPVRRRIDRGRTFGPESLRGRDRIKAKMLRKRLSRRAPPGRGRRPVRRSVEVTAARNRALLARKRSGSRNTRATQRVARRRRRR